METSSVKVIKDNIKIVKEELMLLPREKLIDKILQLEAHNKQLKNLLEKNSKKNKKSKEKTKDFNFEKYNTRHIALHFYYVGWKFDGFVIQEDTANTIENHIFSALVKTCLIKDRQSCNYHRSGRTDKGVSSFGQVISLDVRSKFSADKQNNLENLSNELDYCTILNRVLPKEIQCISWHPVENEFSARFNCNSRTYKYFFPRGNLNIEIMRVASKKFIGIHDFRNFCKMDVAHGVVNFLREINFIEINQIHNDYLNKKDYDIFEIEINSKAFLWHQIRCIISILFLVGEGKESPDVIDELFNIERNPRRPQYHLASEIPLNLYSCLYDINNWVFQGTNLAVIVRHLQHMWTIESIKSSMLRSMLDSLENKLNNQQSKQIECLINGARFKQYKSILELQKCVGLEEKIQHFVKKQKIELIINENDKINDDMNL